MDFVRSYFFTNELLSSWTLFSSKLDWGLSANLILMKTRLKRIESKIAREDASKTHNASKTQNTSKTQYTSYTQNLIQWYQFMLDME